MTYYSVDDVYNLIMGTHEQAMDARSIISKHTKQNDDTKIFLNDLRDKLSPDIVKLTETKSDDYWKVSHFIFRINSLLNEWMLLENITRYLQNKR